MQQQLRDGDTKQIDGCGVTNAALFDLSTVLPESSISATESSRWLAGEACLGVSFTVSARSQQEA
ncbi:hypothetical protein HNV11_14705 [Spirosoma taeanense]|uniref:Uncharacterized protein n=1 Tax=Spirosoma taeanense TaxID=2735870 RepID=A0A6M5Y9B0_9BACT|nr:hypothetical protein [Spirosoma taeanense]QJW90539.1 hypothetical protein HNV11_14705 [Spirosoma taeanense]